MPGCPVFVVFNPLEGFNGIFGRAAPCFRGKYVAKRPIGSLAPRTYSLRSSPDGHPQHCFVVAPAHPLPFDPPKQWSFPIYWGYKVAGIWRRGSCAAMDRAQASQGGGCGDEPLCPDRVDSGGSGGSRAHLVLELLKRFRLLDGGDCFACDAGDTAPPVVQEAQHCSLGAWVTPPLPPRPRGCLSGGVGVSGGVRGSRGG